jgi:hypothetical protein
VRRPTRGPQAKWKATQRLPLKGRGGGQEEGPREPIWRAAQSLSATTIESCSLLLSVVLTDQTQVLLLEKNAVLESARRSYAVPRCRGFGTQPMHIEAFKNDDAAKRNLPEGRLASSTERGMCSPRLRLPVSVQSSIRASRLCDALLSQEFVESLLPALKGGQSTNQSRCCRDVESNCVAIATLSVEAQGDPCGAE